jgi:hypothetical protein
MESIVIIAGAAAVVATIVWSVFSNFGPRMVPATALSIASSLYIFTWMKTYKLNRGIKRNQLPQTIMQWLIAAGHTVSQPQSPDYEFVIQVTAHNGRHATIAQPKSAPGIIAVAIGMGLSGRHLPAYDALSDDKKEALIRMLQIEISRTGFERNGFDHPLNHMSFARSIFYDASFNRITLLQTIFDLLRGATIITQLINLTLNTPAEEAAQTDTPVTPPPSDIREITDSVLDELSNLAADEEQLGA